MSVVLWLLLLLGAFGAFDTLYYHEWRAKLVAGMPDTGEELRLHVVRDGIYAVIFATLPIVAWNGAWAVVLAALLAMEIVVTLGDFIVEEWVRKPYGGVFRGERVTHTLMGITYGAMLGYLVPVLHEWWQQPSSLAAAVADVPILLIVVLELVAVGVAVSGARDLYALLQMRHGAWPWQRNPA
jgi:hypothetical protein